jgi:hypothetical protein
VQEGVFDTFDPEGVGDIIQGLAASMQTNLVHAECGRREIAS